ncbi:Transcriptional regulator containing GAF, AAA-type ATPase, and DNA-binding Fis domains [Flavobacterium sp. CF108]|uniref:sigma-54-dependent Fis family transcriptional regulator n=1 Tax=unclassified Flavobacterium TaxID=196869 RepID=UPI0008BF583A|nr:MULTISPECIES: sigma 54-interacting transcriptional regulator [unclassified Flavobacterium]SEN90987.1 Transcriptional regulator containing GAF, AAA-type ATPase, and DNA-binding Fis domains [Flavobacterium sp. fv08]SHH25621.1 Transcriptional regulator containing GAF, AAA-type ATPase, and DNA-binding Fis domains [Flavobacterium sp. CF108]
MERKQNTKKVSNDQKVDALQSNDSIFEVSAILLDLGKDITKVREKKDLILLFSKRIKSLFYFTHITITLIDHKDKTYAGFLLDKDADAILEKESYAKLQKTHFTLNEPFIKEVLAAEDPISFMVAEVKDKPQSPHFLQVNYDGGVRELLMTTLWNADEPLGFIHIYTDKPGSFTPQFRNIIKGIAPQLSVAVSNIIKNEELQKKEQEKSFLLDFSNDISEVRTKDDLEAAVRTALKRINPLRGYVIRKLNSDGNSLSTYIYDKSITNDDDPILKELLQSKFPVNDGLQNRVLDSYIPLLFNVDIEIDRGITSSYLLFWKSLGFKRMVGIALRNGDIVLGMLWLAIEEINISLLQGICSQISTAMSNIIANELLESKNNEQAVLLQFSNEIAGVRTKDDLEHAIINVLRDLLDTKLAMLNIFDDDGFGLTSYMYDPSLFVKAEIDFDKMVSIKLDIKEPYTAQVIKSESAIVFNVEEELKTTNSGFAQLWKKVGFENAYGALLKVGSLKVGTLWLLADQLNPSILKGLCSQISVAIANIQANEKLLLYKQQLEHENVYLKEQIKNIYNFSEIIGSGERMQKVYHLMSLVADSNSTVLILGETGTGKELIARAIHNASPRKDKLMIKVNCAAMPANLIESELFGHEKGAFTGATERRIGKFELANNSTLFLDEIGEMPLEAQVKLLRVIQERELERVGGKDTIKVDVRIIAATNRNLEEEVAAGRFRSDLFYRLNVFPIYLPALRERMEDVEHLANFFVAKYNKNNRKNINRIAPKAIQQLQSYLWPGNVRELEHLIERSVLMAEDNVLREVYIPRKTEKTSEEENIFSKSLEEMERLFIISALKRCKGKISGAGGAAEVLDIPGNTLHSKMKKLQITKADYF